MGFSRQNYWSGVPLPSLKEVPVVSFKIKKEFSNFIPFQDCFSYLGSLPISYRSFLIAQLLKNPSAMWETWVRSLGWEDPLDKGKATQSSILAWKIPMDCIVHGGHKGSDMTERLTFTSLHFRVLYGKYMKLSMSLRCPQLIWLSACHLFEFVEWNT